MKEYIDSKLLEVVKGMEARIKDDIIQDIRFPSVENNDTPEERLDETEAEDRECVRGDGVRGLPWAGLITRLNTDNSFNEVMLAITWTCGPLLF